ncbi:alpha-ketoglutarate-dependent dioxygenase AlkB family protein [Aureitalea marina]|uniref:Fe2OG dioxygenase domain-containing protein n=1 Tax=Aureitalea marina TaxID=930804 RepID=A0A2S7KQ93_9FLAO|nr:alpha-ketoglutarate-dependent dioxygenase AlkB [Aureitalea marina]PQB04794.1 hypothetical protein BST85_07705 [Aureitalea marina]
MKLIDPHNPPALPDLEIYYEPEFIHPNRSEQLYNYLLKEVRWQHDKIRVFGKEYDQPRLTALYAKKGLSYGYSGIRMASHEMLPEMRLINRRLQKEHQQTYNAILLNLYRTGADSNGWHSDDEPELGKNPSIASISLGERRIFQMRHKQHKEMRFKFWLETGSLLIMSGSTQHHWQHQLPKTSKAIGQRINLTFRYLIDQSTKG